MPVGPNDDALDTLDSLLRFTDGSLAVVLVDDTRGALAPIADERVAVIPAPMAMGNRGGLWLKIAAGYRHALEHWDFEVLLRMDADSLVIGPTPISEAIGRFKAESRLGMLGAYTVSAKGQPRDFGPAAEALASEIGWRGFRHPLRRRTLQSLVQAATNHGYVSGENCLGAAWLHRAEAVRAIAEHGWLNLPELATSRLSEDHVFALLTIAAGYSLGEFAGPGQPLGVQWIGLPYPASELVERGFRIVHSVRGPEEATTRSFFRHLRVARG